MKATLGILIIVTAILLGTFSCSDDDRRSETFVLVHGAWQGAYAWDLVKARLEQAGQKVFVVELPAHGSDNSVPAAQTLDGYRDKVMEAIELAGTRVILVGHSMGGMVISATAEKIPERIKKLVFVGAFLPANNESLLDLSGRDAQSHLGPSLVFYDDATVGIVSENLIDLFCADGSVSVKHLLLEKYKVEPVIPFTNKVSLTAAGFGSVRKAYLFTAQDKVLGMELQKQMAATALINETYSLESSHCPFLSMPDEVTKILLRSAFK